MSIMFYTPCATPRPIRLSEATRQFAWESLHGKYGDEAMTHMAVPLDYESEAADFEGLSDYDIHDLAIRTIARDAPLRLCPDERIGGAATLGMAIGARIPATKDGQPLQWG